MIEMKPAFRAILATSMASLAALSGCSLIGPSASADPTTNLRARPTGYVYSTLYAKNKVLEVNTVQSRVDNDPIDVPNGPRGLAIDPRDRNLYLYVVCELANTVAVVDRRNRLVVRTISVGNQPYAMAITPNGTRGFVTNSGDDTVSVIDIATNTVIDTVPLTLSTTNTGTQPVAGTPAATANRPLRPRGVTTNASGTMVYVACAGGAIGILQGTPPTSTAGATQTGIGTGAAAGGSRYTAVTRDLAGTSQPLHVAVATMGTSSSSTGTTTGTGTGTGTDLIYITDPNVGVVFLNGPQSQPRVTPIQGSPYDVAVGRNLTTGNPEAVYVTLEARGAVQPFRASDFSPVGEALSTTGSQPQFLEVSPLGTEVYASLAGSNNIAIFGRSSSTLNAPEVFNMQQLNPAYIAPTGDLALGGFLFQ